MSVLCRQTREFLSTEETLIHPGRQAEPSRGFESHLLRPSPQLAPALDSRTPTIWLTAERVKCSPKLQPVEMGARHEVIPLANPLLGRLAAVRLIRSVRWWLGAWPQARQKHYEWMSGR